MAGTARYADDSDVVEGLTVRQTVRAHRLEFNAADGANANSRPTAPAEANPCAIFKTRAVSLHIPLLEQTIGHMQTALVCESILVD
jgi:hypothetical protein